MNTKMDMDIKMVMAMDKDRDIERDTEMEVDKETDTGHRTPDMNNLLRSTGISFGIPRSFAHGIPRA
jgi:hypothetical protein